MLGEVSREDKIFDSACQSEREQHHNDDHDARCEYTLNILQQSAGSNHRKQSTTQQNRGVDLNASALAYWRELGLTPAAYRRITGDAPAKAPKRSALERALEKLDDDGD